MRVPTAELHLHIEGTLEPELALALAARNGLPAPFADPAEFRDRLRFDSLQSFLDLYGASMTVLRTEQDFFDLAAAYLARAHQQGVRHAELSFDPQPHVERGVPVEAVIDGLRAALDDAQQRSGISGGLILCFHRDRPVEEAVAVLAAARPRLEHLLAVGLDSAEVGNPPERFREVYREAARLGLRLTAHAGEEGPPAYVQQALDELGVERIDHGIRSVEDPRLIERLAAAGTPLTVCPLSNVALACVPALDAHPLPAMLAAGLNVSVHSDDPAFFGGYVGDVYTAVHDRLGTSPETLRVLAANSVRSSFAPEHRQRALLAEVEAWQPAAG